MCNRLGNSRFALWIMCLESKRLDFRFRPAERAKTNEHRNPTCFITALSPSSLPPLPQWWMARLGDVMKSYWSGESFLMLNDIKQNVEHDGWLIKERQSLGPREVLPDDFARLGQRKAESSPKSVTRFFFHHTGVTGVGMELISTHPQKKMLKESACRGVRRRSDKWLRKCACFGK